MTFNLVLKRQTVNLFSITGVFHLFRHFGKKKAFVIMYHRVLDSPEKERIFVQPGMYVKTETFRRQITFLKENFQILPLPELTARIEAGKRIGGCCAITFDDGWRDNFIYAYPVLKKFRIPATIFLVTGFINTNRLFWPEEFSYYLLNPETQEVAAQKNQVLGEILNGGNCRLDAPFLDDCIIALKALSVEEREKILNQLRSICPLHLPDRLLLNWNELKEMQASGLINFGGHTVNHVILDQVPSEKAEKEIVCACHDLKEKLGVWPELFAYPNGNYNSEIRNILKKHGIKGAVITKKGWLSGKTDLLEIPRIGMHEDVSRTIPLFLGRIFLKGF